MRLEGTTGSPYTKPGCFRAKFDFFGAEGRLKFSIRMPLYALIMSTWGVIVNRLKILRGMFQLH